MRRPILGFLIFLFGIFTGGCSRQKPAMQFDQFTQDFSTGVWRYRQ